MSEVYSESKNKAITTVNHVFSVDDDNNDSGKNEVYCVCNGPEYGDMVQCSGRDFPHNSWFHFSCINLTSVPDVDWFCPECSKNNDGLFSKGEVVLFSHTSKEQEGAIVCNKTGTETESITLPLVLIAAHQFI